MLDREEKFRTTQNFNVGDVLICKNSEDVTWLSLTKDLEYVILDIEYHKSYYNNSSHYYYYIIDDKFRDLDFSFEEDFDRYFYTKNELRKIKLKKLSKLYEQPNQ